MKKIYNQPNIEIECAACGQKKRPRILYRPSYDIHAPFYCSAECYEAGENEQRKT